MILFLLFILTIFRHLPYRPNFFVRNFYNFTVYESQLMTRLVLTSKYAILLVKKD